MRVQQEGYMYVYLAFVEVPVDAEKRYYEDGVQSFIVMVFVSA